MLPIVFMYQIDFFSSLLFDLQVNFHESDAKLLQLSFKMVDACKQIVRKLYANSYIFCSKNCFLNHKLAFINMSHKKLPVHTG